MRKAFGGLTFSDIYGAENNVVTAAGTAQVFHLIPLRKEHHAHSFPNPLQNYIVFSLAANNCGVFSKSGIIIYKVVLSVSRVI